MRRVLFVLKSADDHKFLARPEVVVVEGTGGPEPHRGAVLAGIDSARNGSQTGDITLSGCIVDQKCSASKNDLTCNAF